MNVETYRLMSGEAVYSGPQVANIIETELARSPATQPQPDSKDVREAMAKALQQFWQGPSGRPWDGTPDSCCVKLPPQAEWFRKLADIALTARVDAPAAPPADAVRALRKARDAIASLPAYVLGGASVEHTDGSGELYQYPLGFELLAEIDAALPPDAGSRK